LPRAPRPRHAVHARPAGREPRRARGHAHGTGGDPALPAPIRRALSRGAPRMSVRRILIVNLTRFGDLLQTGPAVATLQARHPGAAITFLAERNFADVCDGIPDVDRVFRIDLDRLGALVLQGGAALLDGYRYVEDVIAELRA